MHVVTTCVVVPIVKYFVNRIMVMKEKKLQNNKKKKDEICIYLYEEYRMYYYIAICIATVY